MAWTIPPRDNSNQGLYMEDKSVSQNSHKHDSASAFFISTVGLIYVVVGAGASGMADLIAVIMVSIVIAALGRGALGSFLG
jgi:hypothetical protein